MNCTTKVLEVVGLYDLDRIASRALRRNTDDILEWDIGMLIEELSAAASKHVASAPISEAMSDSLLSRVHYLLEERCPDKPNLGEWTVENAFEAIVPWTEELLLSIDDRVNQMCEDNTQLASELAIYEERVRKMSDTIDHYKTRYELARDLMLDIVCCMGDEK